MFDDRLSEGACPQDLCEGQGQGMVCRACTLVHISLSARHKERKSDRVSSSLAERVCMACVA